MALLLVGSGSHAGIMTIDSKKTLDLRPQMGSAPGEQADSAPPPKPLVNTGNPRVTVAFPFSKIEIREPSDQVRDLAEIVWALADKVAGLVRHAAPDELEAADQLAAQAALLARRLGAASAVPPRR